MAADCEGPKLPALYQNAIEEVIESQKFKDYEIVTIQGSSKKDGYMSEILRITAKGVKEDDSKNSLHLILKISPKLKETRELFPVSLFYKREIYIYNRLFPLYDQLQEQYDVPQADRIQHPKLFTAINIELNELLILEDFSAKGFIKYDKQKPLDYEHLSLLVKNLARFHAMSIVLKAKDPAAFEEITLHTCNDVGLNDNYLSFVETTGEKLSPIIENEEERRRTVSYLKNVGKEMKYLLDSKTAAPFNVICHGDYRNSNFLFKYKDGKLIDLRVIDFQIVRYASPVTDLAYMIFLGTDKIVRDNHYEGLLTMYYETLSSTTTLMDVDISKYFPENIYRKHIEQFMAYGSIEACSVLPIIINESEDMPELDDIVDKKPEGNYAYCDLFIERIRDIIKFSMEKGII